MSTGAARVGKLLDAGGETHELGLRGLAQGEQAELHAAIHRRKQSLAVFDMERGLRGAAGVQQAPDIGEFGIARATQQVLQVDFQKSGASKRGGVA